MKINKRLQSVALASAALILLLVLFSSAASAATEQSASPTGTYAYITNYNSNTVSVIDTATNTVTATINVGNYPWGVAVNPTGTKVYVTNGGSGTVSVIDTATNTVTATVNGFSGPIGVVVTPDGSKVYVANAGSDTISVIDTTTNKVTATVPVGNGNFGLAVTPDGSKVYVTKYDGTTVCVIETATNNVTATVNTGPLRYGVAVTPDGKKVYVANWGSNPVVIDTATNTVTATVPADEYSSGVAVTPDGKNVYMTNYNSDTVSVIDTATNTVTATVPVGNTPCGVSVTPDGTKVYVANYNSDTVSVIDTATNTVTATVPVGSGPEVFGQFIASVPESIPPVANFSSNVTEGYAPLTVQFTDLSENAIGWNWDFGDGTNATEQNVSHTYTSAGNYTVNLTASNANGTDSKSAIITVLEKSATVLPVANFSTNVSEGYAPLSVQFTDLSENATEWDWDFGDGNNSTKRNPAHTFSVAGNYTVNLTVSNENGTDSKLATITVSEKPSVVLPVAAFSASRTSGTPPLTVKFTDESTGSPTSWRWVFEDGANTTVKYSQNPIHVYSQAGNYTVKLTVTNAAGSNTTIKTNYITVTEATPKPVAAFSASRTSGTPPLMVKFTDESSGSPTLWRWVFEDGDNTTVKYSQNPIHRYSQAGNYTVKLTVTNAAGKNTTIKTDYIKVMEKPVAAFSAKPTSGKAPLMVTFTDKSTGSPTSWRWVFEDGASTTVKYSQNPIHKYSQAGNYTVKLTATNAAGSNTTIKTDYIKVTTV